LNSSSLKKFEIAGRCDPSIDLLPFAGCPHDLLRFVERAFFSLPHHFPLELFRHRPFFSISPDLTSSPRTLSAHYRFGLDFLFVCFPFPAKWSERCNPSFTQLLPLEILFGDESTKPPLSRHPTHPTSALGFWEQICLFFFLFAVTLAIPFFTDGVSSSPSFHFRERVCCQLSFPSHSPFSPFFFFYELSSLSPPLLLYKRYSVPFAFVADVVSECVISYLVWSVYLLNCA